jgi:hypothetical protein
MADSGGCPNVFELHVDKVTKNRDCLTSLIVPSVRSLKITTGWGMEEEEEALLLCCGLVQMGYKHRLRLTAGERKGRIYFSALACMRAIVCGGGMPANIE